MTKDLENVVINNDCLDIMPKIPDQSIDIVLCDLPYGTTACKWDTIIPFDKLWEQYNRIIKKNGAILLFGSEPFSSYLRMSNIKMYRYDWYWQKDKGSNFLFGNKQPMKVIEIISTFYKHQPIYNPQKTINPKGIEKRHLYFGNGSENSDKAKEIMPNMPNEPSKGKSYEPDKLLPKQLVYFAREQRNKLHPTQKPLELCEYLIKTYTNENDLVLDNCAGSFTTAVACDNLNRRWICIEKEVEYCEIGQKRIEENRIRLSSVEIGV